MVVFYSDMNMAGGSGSTQSQPAPDPAAQFAEVMYAGMILLL